MTQPVVSQITQAVVDALNTGVAEDSFAMPFTAERAYLPVYELPEMADLKVTVVPKRRTVAGGTRGASQQDIAVDIAVQKRVNPAELPESDALLALIESIGNYLRFKPLELDDVRASWLSIEHEPVYAPEHMEQMNQFTSVLTVTYRLLN
jgi:hypothetical protein